MKKRCIIAGASSRALVMFTKRIGSGWCPEVELTGIFDINPGRVLAHCRYSKSAKPYDDFDRMLDAEKPDIVIVTTVDAYHHEYIIKALEAGCDVITEKPMTIDAEKVGAILEAERRTGKKVTVTFNYRFVPFVTKIKEIMLSGQIGEVYNVHMEWMLDRNVAVMGHGASYFRRWNRYMEKSGGLLVHKSTHHFDIINWFIGQNPVKVSAFGELRVYGRNGTYRGERCRTCGHKGECKMQSTTYSYWTANGRPYTECLAPTAAIYAECLSYQCPWRRRLHQPSDQKSCSTSSSLQPSLARSTGDHSGGSRSL